MRRLLITVTAIVAVLVALVVFVSQPGTTHKASPACDGSTTSACAKRLDQLKAHYDGAPVPFPQLAGTSSFLGVADSQLPVVGRPLSAPAGAWVQKPQSITYQWLRGTQTIPGATARSYTPSAADVGHTLTVRVTAHNGAKSTTPPSMPTGVVSAPGRTLTVRKIPSGTYVSVPLFTDPARYSSLAPGSSTAVLRLGSHVRLMLHRAAGALIYRLTLGAKTVWSIGPIDAAWNTLAFHVAWGQHGYVEVWINGSPGVGLPSAGTAGPATRAYGDTGAASPLRLVTSSHATPKVGTTLVSVAPATLPKVP